MIYGNNTVFYYRHPQNFVRAEGKSWGVKDEVDPDKQCKYLGCKLLF